MKALHLEYQMYTKIVRIKRRPKGILIPMEAYSPKPVYEDKDFAWYGQQRPGIAVEIYEEELCLLWRSCFLCWYYTGQGP